MQSHHPIRSASLIWFALAWRGLIAIFFTRIVTGIAVHLAAYVFGWSERVMHNVAAAIGLLDWLIVPTFIIAVLQRRGFGRYRLALRARPRRHPTDPHELLIQNSFEDEDTLMAGRGGFL